MEFRGIRAYCSNTGRMLVNFSLGNSTERTRENSCTGYPCKRLLIIMIRLENSNMQLRLLDMSFLPTVMKQWWLSVLFVGFLYETAYYCFRYHLVIVDGLRLVSYYRWKSYKWLRLEFTAINCKYDVKKKKFPNFTYFKENVIDSIEGYVKHNW